MSDRTIRINNWSDEHSDEDALNHVLSQLAKGYTSGHDSGLYWEIRETDPAKEAGPKLLAALATCPDLPDDWNEWNPDAIRAFTEAFKEWKVKAADTIKAARGEA